MNDEDVRYWKCMHHACKLRHKLQRCRLDPRCRACWRQMYAARPTQREVDGMEEELKVDGWNERVKARSLDSGR